MLPRSPQSARRTYWRPRSRSRRNPQHFVHAYAGITLPNPASVRLHESFGFRPVGLYEQIGHKFGRWLDVGWWHLELVRPPAEPIDPVPWTQLPDDVLATALKS